MWNESSLNAAFHLIILGCFVRLGCSVRFQGEFFKRYREKDRKILPRFIFLFSDVLNRQPPVFSNSRVP